MMMMMMKDVEKHEQDLSPVETSSAESEPIAHAQAEIDVEKNVAAPVAAAAPPGIDPASFPDGGSQAWLCVVGGCCTIFASFGWINCIGVFQNYYEQNQLRDYNSSTIAWIPSTESFMLFFGGAFVGKITDNYGPRLPIAIGSFLHIFGLMMLSVSDKYYQIFLSQAVCSAIGCSMLFFPSMTAAATWFLRHRALAIGIMVAGSSVGGVVLPIMVTHLMPKIGFGWTIRALAFVLFAAVIVGNFTIRSRIPPVKKPFHILEFIRPFRDATFSLAAIGFFFLYIGGFIPFTFIIVQARQQGMSEQLAGYLVSIMNAASTFGRIVPAHYGDRFGTFNVFILLTGFGSIFTLAIWLPVTSNAGSIAYSALYGFTSGCSFSIIIAMIATISDVRELGVRSGSAYMLSSIGVLVGSPIAGAIANAQKNGVWGLSLFCGVCLVASTVFIILSRAKRVGWNPRRKA